MRGRVLGRCLQIQGVCYHTCWATEGISLLNHTQKADGTWCSPHLLRRFRVWHVGHCLNLGTTSANEVSRFSLLLISFWKRIPLPTWPETIYLNLYWWHPPVGCQSFYCYPYRATSVKAHYRAWQNYFQELSQLKFFFHQTYLRTHGLKWQPVATVSEEHDLVEDRGFIKTDRILTVNCHTPESFKRMPNTGYNTALKWRASHPTYVE